MDDDFVARLVFPTADRQQAWRLLAVVERSILAVTTRDIVPYVWRGGDDQKKLIRGTVEELSVELGDGWSHPDPAYVEALIHVGNGYWSVEGQLRKSHERPPPERFLVSATFFSHDAEVVDETVSTLVTHLAAERVNFVVAPPENTVLVAADHPLVQTVGDPSSAPARPSHLRAQTHVTEPPSRDAVESPLAPRDVIDAEAMHAPPGTRSTFSSLIADHALGLVATVIGGLIVTVLAAALGLSQS